VPCHPERRTLEKPTYAEAAADECKPAKEGAMISIFMQGGKR